MQLEKLELNQDLLDWAFRLCNEPSIYRDGVEQILEVAVGDRVIIILAVDEGNPPVIPLKQLAFKFKTSDEDRQDLIGFEIKLLNPDEVESGQSRPAQFSAMVPTTLWEDLESDLFWESEDCEDCVPDPALL